LPCTLTHAAPCPPPSTCTAGEYLQNGECATCTGEGNYCPVGSTDDTTKCAACSFCATPASQVAFTTPGYYCPAGATSQTQYACTNPSYYCPAGATSATEIDCSLTTNAWFDFCRLPDAPIPILTAFIPADAPIDDTASESCWWCEHVDFVTSYKTKAAAFPFTVPAGGGDYVLGLDFGMLHIVTVHRPDGSTATLEMVTGGSIPRTDDSTPDSTSSPRQICTRISAFVAAGETYTLIVRAYGDGSLGFPSNPFRLEANLVPVQQV
jgi:hypothetical protein